MFEHVTHLCQALWFKYVRVHSCGMFCTTKYNCINYVLDKHITLWNTCQCFCD